MASGATGGQERAPAKRITIFNHKGGVGKTTLTFNIAAALAAAGKRVLLVDSDPQCNISAYVIDGDVLDDLLDHSDLEDGQTLWSALKPVVEAAGGPKIIEPIELASKLRLLPGDIRVSEFEEELNDFWRQCLQRKRRGFAGTMALSNLVNTLCKEKDIEFVFYDSGPNIGPLNRIILLDCDFFIVPAACDLFSVRAMKTLGHVMFGWISEWQTISELAPEDMYVLPGKPRFLGYIPQSFSVYRGGIAKNQSKYLALLDNSVQTEIVAMLRDFDLEPRSSNYRLGEVKDFGVLVAASQLEGVPIASVRGAGTEEQRSAARQAFSKIAERIIKDTA